MSSAGEKRIRLKDIAKMAGVDLSLVSRVVNHNAEGEVSEEKRKKIEQIIRETGYVPSSAARSLVTRKTRQLMFIFSDNTLQGLANEYYGGMLHGFSDACSAHKYNCLLNVLDCSNISEFVLPENLKNYSVDGCVIAGFANHPLITHLDRHLHPVVMIEPCLSYENIPMVNRKENLDISGLLDYIRKKGFRHVWLSEGLYQPSLAEIKDIRIEGIDDYKRDVEEVAEFFVEKIASLSRENRPDLVICRGHIALHLLRILKKNGLRCPDDIALMSTSNFEANRFCSPALSLVAQDSREMGRYAGELLFRICEGKISREDAILEARQHIFPITITEREST